MADFNKDALQRLGNIENAMANKKDVNEIKTITSNIFDLVQAINNNTAIISASIFATKNAKGITSLNNLIGKSIKEVAHTLDTAFNSIKSTSQAISGGKNANVGGIGISGLIKDISGIDFKKAKNVSENLKGINLASPIIGFLNQFNTKTFEKLFSVSPEYSMFLKEISGLLEKYSNAPDSEKIIIQQQINSLKEPTSKSPISNIKKAVSTISEIFIGLSSIKNMGIGTILKLGMLSKIDIAKYIGNFLSNIASPNLLKWFQESPSYKKSQIKLLDIDKQLDLLSKKDDTASKSKYQDLLSKKYELSDSPRTGGDMISSVFSSLLDLFSKMGNMDSVSTKSFRNFKKLSNLNFG